ncbi:MAG: hypothetical protein K2Y30_01910 [Flavobacteriaceae bacterium]|nr:hypothetical protein [Flavobacteriaceae bacterium]
MKKIQLVLLDYALKILLVWLVVSAMSCASRKKNSSSEAELHTKTELTTNEAAAEIKVNTNVVVTEKTETNATKTTTKVNYKPIDPTKPSSVTTPEGKTYVLNNAEVTEESTKETNVAKTENSKTDTSSSNTNYWGKNSSYIKLEDLHSQNTISLDKTGFNMWSWLWIMIIIVVLIGLKYLNNRFKWVSYVTSIFNKK